MTCFGLFPEGHFPSVDFVAIGGMALGLSASSLLSQRIFGTEVDSTLGLILGSCGLALVFAFLLLGLVFWIKEGNLWDTMNHSVRGPTMSTGFMAIMNLGVLIVNILGWKPVGLLFWLLGLSLHLLYMMFFYGRVIRLLINGEMNWNFITPVLFVPTVGICVAATSFPGIQNEDMRPLARVLFWIGFFPFALGVWPVLGKYLFGKDIAHARPGIPDCEHNDIFNRKELSPINCILMAPCALLFVGLNSVYDFQDVKWLAITLFIIGIFLGVITLWRFTQFITPPYSPAFAACTFPLVIFTVMLFDGAILLKDSVGRGFITPLNRLAWIMFIFTTIDIIAVCLMHMRHIKECYNREMVSTRDPASMQAQVVEQTAVNAQAEEKDEVAVKDVLLRV